MRRRSRPCGILLTIAALAAATACGASPAPITLDDLSRSTIAINCRAPAQRGAYIGTGTIVHPSGYVLTSTTVVPPNATDIRCHFVGALNRPARLAATDEGLELSVLKVAGEDMPAKAGQVTFRRSESLRVGETAFSFGDVRASFIRSGRFTISLGVVSGLYETTSNVPPQPVYVGEVIETTATVAGGMDGGPLLDSSGRVIGLLSLNVSEMRWLGTAVPVDAFIDRLSELIAEDAKAHARPDAAQAPPAPSVADAKGTSLFPRRDRLNAAFAEAADSVAPSMVGILVDRKKDRAVDTRRARGRPRGGYRAILQRPDGPVTGWLVSEDGHVLTSWFNVWGEIEGLQVVLSDGQQVRAKLLGRDEHKDLALLRFDPAALGEGTKLRPLELNSRTLPVGTPIAAVGLSPGASDHTLTCGIVSATDRLDGAALQINAPVNYGSAGGAVLDVEGHCLAIVSHVRTNSVWSQNSGVGLAVSSRAIRKVMVRLKNGETITKPKRGYLGIRMSQGHLDVSGVVVAQVQPNTPADQSGLRSGDIIAAVDGRAVEDPADLARVISGERPGSRVKLTVRRKDETKTIEVELAEHPFR